MIDNVVEVAGERAASGDDQGVLLQADQERLRNQDEERPLLLPRSDALFLQGGPSGLVVEGDTSAR